MGKVAGIYLTPNMLKDSQTSLEMTTQTRDALRRIRSAAVDTLIDPEEMQKLSAETMRKFARALLSIEKSHLLHEEDREQNSADHIAALNQYVERLLPKVERLNLTGINIDQEMIENLLLISTRPSYLKQFDHKNNTLVTLLSTGAISLALTSYLFEVPIYVAAVDKNRSQVIRPKLPENPIVVTDDIVGQQARAVKNVLVGQGKTVRLKNIIGQDEPNSIIP